MARLRDQFAQAYHGVGKMLRKVMRQQKGGDRKSKERPVPLIASFNVELRRLNLAKPRAI
jgi:hypothetical protein